MPRLLRVNKQVLIEDEAEDDSREEDLEDLDDPEDEDGDEDGSEDDVEDAGEDDAIAVDGDAAAVKTCGLTADLTFGLIDAIDMHEKPLVEATGPRPAARETFKLLIMRVDGKAIVPVSSLKRLIPRARWISKTNSAYMKQVDFRVFDSDSPRDAFVRAVSGARVNSKFVGIDVCAVALKSVGATCISKPDNLGWIPPFAAARPEDVAAALDNSSNFAKYLDGEQRVRKRRKTTQDKVPAVQATGSMPDRAPAAGSISDRADAFIGKLSTDELAAIKEVIAEGDWPLYMATLNTQGCGALEAALIKTRIGKMV